MCRRHVEAIKELKEEQKRSNPELRRTMHQEGLEEDVQTLLKYREDSTLEVHEWISTCKKKRLEDEDLPKWTKEAIAKVWSQIWEDHKARNGLVHHVEEHGFLEARGRL